MLVTVAMRTPHLRSRLSFATRVFLVNSVVLTVATLLLLFSPIEINAPVTTGQALILVAGFLVSLAANLVLLRRVVAPLRRLTEVMRAVEPLEPGRRVAIPGADAEVEGLATAFNDMLGRLERERRESGRRAARAQEEERLRIARELHDQVGQVLTGVMLGLDDPDAREAVRGSLGEVRRIARELRPEALEHLGLQSALRSLCIAAGAKGTLRVEPQLELRGAELSPEVELAIYRVAQEGLTNVLRHAQASEVVVALREVDGGVRLIVRDDGGGLREGLGDGSGMAGMRERALHVGGRLAIASSADTGTELRLDVPLPEGLP
jgi:two-component system, NarL family, sensor histidine kinase UhpB